MVSTWRPKKLKHYFQEHPITVVSAAPVSEILGNKDASGQVAKWAIELAAYAPQYARRDTIKSQAVAEFLVDWAEMEYEPSLPDSNYWRMHFDGSKVKEGLGAVVEVKYPDWLANPVLRILSGNVKDVRGLHTKFICRHQLSKLFPSLGHLQCGVWIWWDRSNQPEVT